MDQQYWYYTTSRDMTLYIYLCTIGIHNNIDTTNHGWWCVEGWERMEKRSGIKKSMTLLSVSVVDDAQGTKQIIQHHAFLFLFLFTFLYGFASLVMATIIYHYIDHWSTTSTCFINSTRVEHHLLVIPSTSKPSVWLETERATATRRRPWWIRVPPATTTPWQ